MIPAQSRYGSNVAICGFEWWQIDPSGWIIRGFEKLGLAYDVRGVPPEKMRQARRRLPNNQPQLEPSTSP